MSATELDEVQALLERVLPDPSGYAQRLLMQVMTRLGQSAAVGADPLRNPATAANFTPGDPVTRPSQWATEEYPVNTNILLAAALGACKCWGLQASCQLCDGKGSAGWAQPDPELFDEFVRPAIARLARNSANGHQRRGGTDAAEDNANRHTEQGEST
jgi:hypothetical protein